MKAKTLFCSGICLLAALTGPNATPLNAQERQPSTQTRLPIPDDATEPKGLIAEPGIFERSVVFMDRHFGSGDVTNGFYTDFWTMVPGAGWISGGPGYRHWYAGDRVFLNTSAAISWRGYKTMQARVELPKLARSRFAVGTQVRWQDLTQVNFFGEGRDAPEFNRSEYRIKSTNIVGYATFRPIEWLGIGGQIGWLEPSILPRAGTFKRDRPDTRDVFADNIVYALPEQPTFVHSEASITADTRDFPRRPLKGGLYRAAATTYSDRDFGLFSFRRYEAEAAQFIPILGSRVVFALHGWVVGSDVDEGRDVPFYLQPSLGGNNSIRSYTDYRFHDRSLLLVNAETRVALMTHLDAAVFFDAGNVARRVGDLNLDKRAYGFGFRVHSRRDTFARLDMARGDDGWRLFVGMTDPLNLARLTRRSAPLPFVP